MKNKIALAISAVLALGVAQTASSMDIAAPKGLEKCFGVAKAGINDCGTAHNNCSGEAKRDRDPEAWIFTPTGLCQKIAGGSTEPVKNKA
jgi:uncharacterized membrane protein